MYGIGGNAINEIAIKLIYQVKKRPFDNPLICHFANINEIEKNFTLQEKDYELANTFWPGPLTLILEKNKESKITPLLSNNQNLVGCRIPNNEIAIITAKNVLCLLIFLKVRYKKMSRQISRVNMPFLLPARIIL